MRINPVQDQTNFKAINQKYYQRAVRESKGVKRYGEILEMLRYEVAFGEISPQDGIDTVKAIIELRGKTSEGFEHVLDGFRRRLLNGK